MAASRLARESKVESVQAPTDGLPDATPVEVKSAATPAATADDETSIEPGDEMAESAFRAEARERGEALAPAAAARPVVAEEETEPLPPLDSLVQRIPADVRDTLEELFRAKFKTVRRVPVQALKPKLPTN